MEPIPLESSKEAALYIIDRIRPEIERENFRPIVRYVNYLYELVRLAAIVEERNMVGWPTIEIPNPGDSDITEIR